MNFESIISHMNDHHKSNLVDLCKKFGGIEQVQDVFLKVLILMAWILFTMIKKIYEWNFLKKPMKTRLKIL